MNNVAPFHTGFCYLGEIENAKNNREPECTLWEDAANAELSMEASAMQLLSKRVQIAGYFPLVGIITGIAKIIYGIFNCFIDRKCIGASFITRGFLEMLPFAGIALLIADQVLTRRYIEKVN